MHPKNLSKTKTKYLRGLEQNSHLNSKLRWIIIEPLSVFGKLVCYTLSTAKMNEYNSDIFGCKDNIRVSLQTTLKFYNNIETLTLNLGKKH